MTDDSYAENSCVVCWHPRGCAEYRLHPSHQNTFWNERWDITCLFTKVHSITYVTRTGAASTWKTCAVTAATTTWYYSLWSTRSTHVKLMWRRLVCFCVWRRMEKCAQSELIHVSLVKKPHFVWVWSGSASTQWSPEMNRSVRRKRSDCVKEMQNNIYYNTDFSSLVGEKRSYSVVVAYWHVTRWTFDSFDFLLFFVLSVFVLSYTFLGTCAPMDIRTSQAMHHLKTLSTPCSSHLACWRADSILTWLLFLRSRHSSHKSAGIGGGTISIW